MAKGAQYTKRKHEVLHALRGQFARGQRYSELEVDAAIEAVAGTLDGAAPADERFEITHLRRGLVEMGILARERDGSAYWRRD